MLKSPGPLIIQAILLLLLSFQARSDLTEDIRKELQNELYPFSDLLPDFNHPAQQTTLAVVEFHTDKNDEKLLNRAISEILRFRIQFVPGMPLYMPAFENTRIDAGLSAEAPPPMDGESFQAFNRSLGIENSLTGSISTQGSKISLDMKLLKASSGELIKQKSWKAERNALAKPVIEISRWVYSTLAVKLTQIQLTYLAQAKSLTDGAIAEYLGSFQKLIGPSRKARHELSKELLAKHPEFALFAYHALTSRTYANNQEGVYKNLELYEQLEANFPKNPGVSLESYRAMEIDMLPKHKVSRRLDSMKQLIIANPGDPTIIVNYCDKLTDNGNALDGISILLEAVELWPGQYRLWWSLGWALNSHAWELRGDKYWRNVPERQQKQFLSLSVLADRAIDRAISLNPRNAGLLNMKINSLGSLDGYSDELLQVFDQAVEISPDYPRIYNSAMNYAQKKWGGTALARRHIIETAEKHNPGAPWIEAMKRVHAVELDDFQDRLAAKPMVKYALELLDHPYANWVLIIVGILVFWIVFLIGRKSAFAEVYDYNEQDDSPDNNPAQHNGPR